MTRALQVAKQLPEAVESLREMVPEGSTILLAVSGGSDSSGLLQVGAACAKTQKIQVVAGFVDHGLREGTESEWEQVEKSARAAGLEAVRRCVSRDKVAQALEHKGGVQEWAREERYGLLLDMAKEIDAGFIATAHTIDDQAETVLLRLMRGTGLDGLVGILPHRVLGDVEIIRPMLCVRRANIRKALADCGLCWIEDPSNENNKFARVKVRNELLPMMESIQPKAGGKLAALATESRELIGFVHDVVDDKKGIVPLRLSDGVKVDNHTFAKFPWSLRGRLVRSALRHVQGDLRRIEREHIQMILDLQSEAKSTRDLPIPGKTVVQIYRGSLYVFPRELPERPTGSGHPSAAGPGLWRLRFAALGAVAEVRAGNAGMVEHVEVRARRDGDRLLGSDTKFKELLSERKIPWPYRDFVPVLAVEDRVISCPALLRSRNAELEVHWMLDDNAPFLDIDFPLTINGI